MAEHLTLVSLRRALSTQANVSPKVADEFLSALFQSIQDGLIQDGSVTIAQLGTFKLQDVAPRQSMDVTTGERITLDGYKKVIFNAANTAANAPQSTTDAPRRTPATKAPVDTPIDPIKKLGEQAEEIKDILSELGAMPTPATPVTPDTPDTPPTPDTPVTPATPDTPPTPVTPVTPPTPVTPATPVTPVTPVTPAKPMNPWLTAIITIAVFCLLLIGAYCFLRYKIVHWADGMREHIEQKVHTTPQAEQPTLTVPDSNDATTEQTEAEADAIATSAPTTEDIDWYDDAQRTFTDIQAIETVGKDSRLAWIAKKHYGNKALWVFIYEANRDVLSSPSHVLPGMHLRIPRLPECLTDSNNPRTAELIQRLETKYN